MKMRFICIHFMSLLIFSCQGQEQVVLPSDKEEIVSLHDSLLTGADVLLNDLSIVQDKNIALLVNPTSRVNNTHLLDALLKKNVSVKKIFAPEHGFRGDADAGEKIKSGVDTKTGLPVVSLYGNHKKPTMEDLAGIDLVIFDVQDVGVRFYTYISTLHYLMEACAENNVDLLVLDRPNPNGNRVDGSVLNETYTSFVGMHPVPILHGMTVGEYAQMIQGEKWLNTTKELNLRVIPCKNYTHETSYNLPIKPSPNLPNARAVYLYPSTCLFEGTVISEGRGTDVPFQIFGAPNIDSSLVPHTFTPKKLPGAKYPKFENETCYGFNISKPSSYFQEESGINLNYIITLYNLYPDKDAFFLKNGFFDKLAGGDALRNAIIEGKSAEEIKASWERDLNKFKTIRKKYLLYPDFME